MFIEATLANIPPLVELEKVYKVTKFHQVIILTVIIVWATLVVKNIHGGPLTDIVGYAYPAYASIKAVDSGDKVKYTQWLSYWVIFGLAKILENFNMTLLHMLPYYYFFKMIFLIWAMSTRTQGAYIVFHVVVKHWIPYLDRTFGNMFGGVMQDHIKSTTEAQAKAPELGIAPPPSNVPRIGQIQLTGPGTNAKSVNRNWGYAPLGLRGR
eukprot:jgi/Hompol1/3229/HPOL_003171-RA